MRRLVFIGTLLFIAGCSDGLPQDALTEATDIVVGSALGAERLDHLEAILAQ